MRTHKDKLQAIYKDLDTTISAITNETSPDITLKMFNQLLEARNIMYDILENYE